MSFGYFSNSDFQSICPINWLNLLWFPFIIIACSFGGLLSMVHLNLSMEWSQLPRGASMFNSSIMCSSLVNVRSNLQGGSELLRLVASVLLLTLECISISHPSSMNSSRCIWRLLFWGRTLFRLYEASRFLSGNVIPTFYLSECLHLERQNLIHLYLSVGWDFCSVRFDYLWYNFVFGIDIHYEHCCV